MTSGPTGSSTIPTDGPIATIGSGIRTVDARQIVHDLRRHALRQPAPAGVRITTTPDVDRRWQGNTVSRLHGNRE